MTKSKTDMLVVDIPFSPADLVALAEGRYIGDPVRRAIQTAADNDDREVEWETIRTWVNKEPTTHKGIDIRVFVKAPKKETENE